MSTDEDTVANLKIHPETAELVAKHEPEVLAGHLKELYNRFHGSVAADWLWVAKHLKGKANDPTTAQSNQNAKAEREAASQVSEPSRYPNFDTRPDPEK